MNKNIVADLKNTFTEIQLVAGVKLFANEAVQHVDVDEQNKQLHIKIDDSGLFTRDLVTSFNGELTDLDFEHLEDEDASAIVAALLYLHTQTLQAAPTSKASDLSEGSWQAFLDERRFERPSCYPNMARHRVIYVIDQDSKSQQYRVTVKKSYLTKANKFTKIEDLPFSVVRQDPLPKFVAPEDRRILHMMWQALPEQDAVEFFPEREFASSGETSDLFRFIIKTGRGFWESTEASRLVFKEQDSHQLNNPWFRITKVFSDFYLNMDTGHCGPVVTEEEEYEEQKADIDNLMPQPTMLFASKRLNTPWLDSLLTEINYLDVLFDYGGQLVRPELGQQVFLHRAKQKYVQRHAEQEYSALMQLKDVKPIQFIKDPTLSSHFDESQFALDDDTQWLDFMVDNLPSLRKSGWKIVVDKSFGLLVRKVDDWYGIVEQAADSGWFDISIGVVINGERVNILPLILEQLKLLPGIESLHNLQQQDDDELFVVSRKQGERIGLPMARVKPILNTLVELLDGDAVDENGALQLSKHQLTQLVTLDQQFEQRIEWTGNFDVQKRLRKLASFKALENISVPQDFQASLRDYQQSGVNWLQFLRNYELGGILADDMGLGKTVQTLAHLLIEHQREDCDLPSLIVAPTSLMANWRREAKVFAPSLKVLVLHGTERKEKFASINDYDLVLTTYPLLIRDAEYLMEYRYHYAVLDEAQVIKNSRSKMAQTAYLIPSRYRLCLTGTPVENHLGELWSQFNFLMPGFLGDEERFTRLFRTPIEKQGNDDRRKALVSRVNPFLLRRTKDAVVSELPPKTVIEELIELDDEQSTLYESIRIAMHDRIRNAIKANGMGKNHLLISDALLKLRQVCCAPSLVKLESAKDIEASAKLDWISTMVPSMVEEGRRILIFSQFTEMLKLIEQRFDELDVPFVKLTGSTRDRETPVKRFQAEEVPVFLISLKAGGTGLNLTAADTVIHYDPWWNPAAENQASDRAYRIGQDKPVFVYKLICKNTVEEKIQAMQERKKQLADSIYSKGITGGGLSQDDINALFEPLSE